MPGIPAMEPEPEVLEVLGPEPGAADACDAEGWDAGCDEASTTVAARTRTAATPTVASAAHHNRAATPSADQRSVTLCVRRSIAPPQPSVRRQH
jgi:hypothetical protein